MAPFLKIKQSTILVFCMLILFIGGCAKNGLTEFDLGYQTSFTIPSTTGINIPLSVLTPDITTNSSAEFKNKGTNSSLVKEVRLTSAVLTITDPPGKTFSFLKSVHIFISANGSPDLEIAYADVVPNQSQLTLISTGVILDPYIKADKFKISAKVVTKETILQDITILCNLSFHVKAGLL
jgi:hypothetical protein